MKAMPVSPARPSGFPGSLFAGTSESFTRSFERGQIICAIGEECRGIYFIRRGLVKITTLSGDGKEVILSIRKENDIFGELGLCRSPCPVSVVAMEPTEIAEIRIEDLSRQLLRSQDAAYEFSLWVVEKLSEAFETIGEVSFDNVHTRLAKALIKLAERFGDEIEPGTQLSCFITQEEIAQMVSATREAVSSALKDLRRCGLINYTRRGKLIIYRQKLIDELTGSPAADAN